LEFIWKRIEISGLQFRVTDDLNTWGVSMRGIIYA